MRCFFGFSIDAPWSMSFPEGRVIAEEHRHITLAFLGEVEKPVFENFPKPNFTIGPVGICDELLFLPKDSPRVVSNHVSWLDQSESITSFQKGLLDWLEKLGLKVDRRPFLSHLSIARAPFNKEEWKQSFEKLPIMITGIHLFESIGDLQYSSIWEMPLLPAFEEFEHTADIGFTVRGNTFEELYLHGAIAMGFKHPPFMNFLQKKTLQDLQSVVRGLNHMVHQCDRDIGCPFKAVSHHGKLIEKDGIYTWEMIVDV